MSESFWRATAPLTRQPTRPAMDPVDVLVVGAGYTGLTAACELAAAGAQVAVIDARGPGGGASASNGGIVAPGPNGPYAEVSRRLGRERARQLMQLSLRVVAFLEELADSTPLDLELSLPGHLVLAESEEERALLKESADQLLQDGFRADWLEARDLPQGLSRHAGGGLLLDGGFIHSGRFTAALAERAEASGARIYAGQSLTGLVHLESGEIAAQIGPGGKTIRAGQVLLATNAWTRRVRPDLPIVPQRGQVLVTEPLKPYLPYAVGARSGFDYFHQRGDGRIVMGGGRDRDLMRECTDQEGLNPTLQDGLVALVEQIAGRPVVIEARWSGIMGFTADKVPIAGALEEGVYVAAGFSGHGVVVAPEVGRLLARAMRGEPAPELNGFDPHRFRAE